MSAQMIIEFPNLRPLIGIAKGIAIGLASAVGIVLIFMADNRIGHAVAKSPAPTHMVGDFTGTYVNGAPLYRLPPIQVTARRETN
jgi:hypothetical protein